ncbi:MAG: peptidylprolyl isomerase [Sphingobium sp.]|nr:peptidylprolyl isomerase [Sphingobium sp.]MBP6112759.1 peptidylprolyl isomerase [Sphingobium sp.]MBP8671391.1 peptidylprolyl isomerase [Sphingobium sp.]MBP9156280.1 peptidylprolyl isomerase [Sphingobium sp.]MCC6482570.1 peptidylprolyl isomerase [Sphingomonadaceae bacterium]
MTPSKFVRLILAALLAVGAYGAGVAYAQNKAQAEEMEKAERSAKAARQAEELRKAPQVAVPSATVPVDPTNIWVLHLSNGGAVRIQLRPDVAPNHVARIKELTNRGFYNGLVFHRVIEDFMAQGGDPKGDGTGGSELPDLQAEFSFLPHVRGVVSMARSQDSNSANSQFFIMLMPRMQLDRKYTVFGRVIEGMAFADAIAKGEPPENPTKIISANMEVAAPSS